MTLISPYIWAVIAGWVVAQGTKYLLVVGRTGKLSNLRQLYLSGNMPSAHSASVMALLTTIALRDGVESGLFALAALFASIVMYDAMMVRRSSGEQGIALQRLIKEQKSDIPLPRAAKGHTPFEVLVGSILGLLIGCIVFYATN
ncbi:MAG: divergent PAP2 family protein [Candidatus Saccharimonadales bacterium]